MADAEQRLQEDPSLRVSVVMADLDGLKYANDTYGHDAGDALIRAFAEVLVETVPAAAVVARLGGDEFGVLVEGEDVDGESLLRAVRAATARRGATGGVPLSASLGWACVPPLASVVEAASAADEQAALDKRRRRAGRRTDPIGRIRSAGIRSAGRCPRACPARAGARPTAGPRRRRRRRSAARRARPPCPARRAAGAW